MRIIHASTDAAEHHIEIRLTTLEAEAAIRGNEYVRRIIWRKIKRALSGCTHAERP